MLSLLSFILDTLSSMIYLELCFKRILIKGPDEPYYNFDVCFTKIWCQTNKQESNFHRKKITRLMLSKAKSSKASTYQFGSKFKCLASPPNSPPSCLSIQNPSFRLYVFVRKLFNIYYSNPKIKLPRLLN